MTYSIKKIADVSDVLKKRLSKDASINLIKSNVFKSLSAELATLPNDKKAAFGKELNQLKAELIKLMDEAKSSKKEKTPIDVTAPFDVNTHPENRPQLLQSSKGSVHPLMKEIELIRDIFCRMGFEIEQSRWLDDNYHMFDTLNFPKGHPARDDYDTFNTEEGLVAPAHTSTMQNRMLKKYKANLAEGRPIAVLLTDRVFRNEDLDARHEHTFHQYEGIFVDKGVHAGMLIATLKTYFQNYFGRDLEVKTQPFYFPFTEPSFEFAASCLFCEKKGCNICSYSGWIELGGCGMIHPNVLKMGGVDPVEYSGFAWGFGVERIVMLKYGIEDVRHFQSGQLDFLRQFS